MKLEKYFWGFNQKAIKETKMILRNPEHPQFVNRMVSLLSRCDQPKELFSIISKQVFVESWPKVRQSWKKNGQARDFFIWWESIYETLTKRRVKPSKGEFLPVLKQIGELIRKARIEKGWTQKDIAARLSMKQPDISDLENGQKNLTISTLWRICQVLEMEFPSLFTGRKGDRHLF